MFKRILTTALVLGALNVHAAKTDSSVSTQMDQNLSQSTMAAKGFRIGLVKSNMDVKSKSKLTGDVNESNSNKVDGDQSIGLTVGYAQIPVRALGVIGTLTYETYKPGDADEDGETKLKILRAEGSLTYGINQNIFLLGGFNIEHMTGLGLPAAVDTIEDQLKIGYGLQIGAGAQLTPNVGLDLVYRYSNHRAEAKIVSISTGQTANAEIDMAFQGPQLTLTGTF